jgi:hypothetical protein
MRRRLSGVSIDADKCPYRHSSSQSVRPVARDEGAAEIKESAATPAEKSS